MTPDDRLKAAFGADTPPPRDYAFTAAVMARVARRELQLALLKNVPIALAASAVLWSAAPALEPLVSDLAVDLQVPVALGLTVLLGVFATLRIFGPRRA